MTIKQALKKYHHIETELLLAHIFKKPNEFLYMEPDFILSSYHFNILSKLIKRRKKGEPIAYILGYKDFYGLRFRVNKNVLIPRPETEWVVEKVVSCELRVENGKKIKILDIGTGSGAIIISLAKALQATPYNLKAVLYASDISKKVLDTAKFNAKQHKVKIKFIENDLLKNVKEGFDIIIANLPYGWRGPKNKFSSVKDGLKFEPQQALFTTEKGLYFIRRLLEQIASLTYKPKLVYIEFDPRQKIELSKLIKKILPQAEIFFHKDLNNLWRYAEIKI